MTEQRKPLIIAGGGLAGCLAALALARQRPDVPFLLIEGEERFGGNHIWSFFDEDLAARDRWLVDDFVCRRWAEHEVRFPRRTRILKFGYNSIWSRDLDTHIRAVLPAERYRLGRRIMEIGASHVTLEEGERLEASAVIDARGGMLPSGLDLAWQKFVGRTYRFDRPHGHDRPIIMDSIVDQDQGYRFVYSLPFSATELLVEDTYYSDSPNLNVPLLGEGLEMLRQRLSTPAATVVSEESGVLPVLLGGRLSTLWPASEPPVARLGLRGGFFHPTTGYSLPDAVRNAALLARQEHFGSAALHSLYSKRAAALWDERLFYQRLNRMLFRAAEPRQRYRVLEHFYRLPEPLIARFYAGRLTMFDKARILSGRPPVPIGRALRAMRERGA